jgi:hypothetical protein
MNLIPDLVKLFSRFVPASTERPSLRLVCAEWRRWLDAPECWADINIRLRRGLLGNSSSAGLLDSVQWLTSAFGLTAADIRIDKCGALWLACEEGHLPVAQWLVTAFGLTVEDARAEDNYALRKARKNGHQAVEQWLLVTFPRLEG